MLKSMSKSPFFSNPLVESQLIKRNAAALSELLQWLGETPKITTYRINLLKTTVLAFGKHLQKVLDEKYEHSPKVYEHPLLPEVLCIGETQQQKYLTQANAELKEIIVDSSCGAAVLRGAHIYAPGVLAMQAGTKLNEQVQVYVDLLGKCKKGTNCRYECAEKLFIGIGTTRMQRYQLYQVAPASGIAIEMKATISAVPCLGDLSSDSEGQALLQNLPSIACVRILNPQPGECVLDMCAAPGNKTTHIAEMMRDEGLIVALDKAEKRIAYIKENIEREQLQCIRTFAFDATKAYAANGNMPVNLAGPPFVAECFDRILLDAPCSALGNRPVLASKMTTKMLQSFPNVQRKLFANAVALLKPGGVLVYSTCTVTEDENESIVAWALNKFPQLQLIEALPRLGGFGLSGLGLNEQECKLVQRFGPTHTNADQTIDTVGFFIAKFSKQSY